ncbi:hypothetical protein METBIDRAFT_41432 [Metschnikowia bicuspidata var. bicuspidata NRRL YB-4993]|uniref:Uncharacterized protein n=1 Tax=Metschnikowia bicuspidata var. bicuspidata NRRL YB-4993 TaxID=869754 RepID=A0A1A0HCJ3_9ASCO|nr:hypothetical protein METBIDRAFT_41432 [Metschnikowia bicuspidata var. bicuspidata NRRL YB-4993]OBA21643.1 hypothetical protein METBIDRAFT_41432 [Metschnikowia bicuspidata var. bicuspidata NRRL YB-4993]
MGLHSASTVLGDIIDELRLKYDPSAGLLDGDAVREVPSLNTLQNVGKLLTKLSASLAASEEHDRALLLRADAMLSEARLKPPPPEDEAPEPEATAEAEHSAGAAPDGALKRERAGAEQDGGGEPGPPAKKRRLVNSKDDPKPPVQTGSYTQGNDTRLKNPKSEFVGVQTLSQTAVAELGLFSEENNGLETQGKEYLKKKYGVALYPANDLKRMLPGEIPDHDFSKTKAPANQVQFSTYQSYIESFFRLFAGEDVAFVKDKFVIPPGFDKNYDPLVSPYLVPKLGPFYTEAWAEEDAALGSKLALPSFQRPPLEAYRPKGDPEDLVDDKLLTEDVSCGPLSTRLLSAILSVHEAKKPDDDADDADNMSDTMKSESSFIGEDMFGGDSACQLNMAVPSEDTDFLSMEERLKRELKYIGIFTNTPLCESGKAKKGSVIDSDDWIINREDDEICAEIRQLQDELKGAVVRNRKRKKALLPVLEEHLAYQEFSTILEDLDKQVDQAYTKRLKAKSKRKKLAPETTNLAQQQTANSGLKTLLEKRTRWISNIGKLFDAPEVMKRIPDSSVFANDVHSDDDEGDAEVEAANEDAS